MRTVRLRVTMRDVVPRVERVIDLPATITLDELHEVLQVALGWTDSHLHQFRTDTTIYAVPFEEWDDGEAEVDERGVPLPTLPPRFVYAYDLGDGWEHEIEALGRGGDVPGCVGGEGACPPEDCGGAGGYAELLEALADARHPEHRAMRTWVGDRLRLFDRDGTAQRVRDAVGAVPGSVRLLLDLLAGGVRLTPGGRLPRAVARAVQEQRPGWYPLGRPASIEEDLLPLAALHDMLRHVRLLRLANGVLHPRRPPRTRPRPCDGSEPGLPRESSPPWSRSARSPWSRPAARCRSQTSPPRCSRYSATAGSAAGSRSRPGTWSESSATCPTSSRHWI
jgi:hypothetical protein